MCAGAGGASLLATVSVSSVSLAVALGALSAVSTTTEASSVLHLGEYCSSGFCRSRSRLTDACISAALTCAAFLSLRSDGGGVDSCKALEASVKVLAQAFLLAAFFCCMEAHLASSCFDSCLDGTRTFHRLIAGGLGACCQLSLLSRFGDHRGLR